MLTHATFLRLVLLVPVRTGGTSISAIVLRREISVPARSTTTPTRAIVLTPRIPVPAQLIATLTSAPVFKGMLQVTSVNATRIVPARIMQLPILIPASSGVLTSIPAMATLTATLRTSPSLTRRALTAKLSLTRTASPNGAGGTPLRSASSLPVQVTLAGWFLAPETTISVPRTMLELSDSAWERRENYNSALP
jgi:hypothetical protein